MGRRVIAPIVTKGESSHLSFVRSPLEHSKSIRNFLSRAVVSIAGGMCEEDWIFPFCLLWSQSRERERAREISCLSYTSSAEASAYHVRKKMYNFTHTQSYPLLHSLGNGF